MSYTYSDSDQYVSYFEGGVTARVISHPTRAFAVEVTFYLDHPRLRALGDKKPPPHFHPFQEEYFTMLEGEMTVELEGREMLLTPAQGEFCIPRWVNHRIYPPASSYRDDGPKKAICLASGEQSFSTFQLDFLFFENWYGYQDLLVLKGQTPDLVQIMSLWDAGDCYLSPPWWLPFGKYISLGASVIIGRYIGGLVGYQPYFKEWSSDWSLACDRMEKVFSQRRYADRTKKID